MATAYKKGDGDWSSWTVAKIKGENGIGIDGTDGSDGKSVEFVYYRTQGAEPSIKEVNDVERGTYDPESAAQRTEVNKDLDRDDFFPAVSIATKTDGDYWHDHPSGVTEQLPYEWVATRTSTLQNGKRYWTSKFSVALWSKYGVNGRDGDGVEYVFWGLSEQDVQQLNSTWPTQRASNAQNNGSNVDPTRKDTSNRSITGSEYLPAILINNTKRQAVDDNPGIENYQYVFASMRKYNGASREWGEFSEIKLWNEQNASNIYNVVLDIEDDTHPVFVDDNGRITDRRMDYNYSTDSMYLYKDLVLLSNGDVYVVDSNNNDVKVAELINNSVQSNCYNNITSSQGITVSSNGLTAKVYPYWAWKYEDSNSSSVTLRVVFDTVSNQNPVLNDSFDIIIKVKSADGAYVGSDLLRLVPKHDEKEVELLGIPGTQRTAEEGGKTYSDSEFRFYGWYGSNYTPLSLVADTTFYFKYDDEASWTSFTIPANNSRLATLRNSIDGVTEGDGYFYFDRSGSFISDSASNVNVNGEFFRIWLYNSDYSDNNHGIWTNWSAIAYVRASAFTATNDYPVNELYFGIGFDGNNPVDEANVHIIYPGKNGQPGSPGQPGQPGEPGENGSYKKELYCLGTANSYDGTWSNSWASTGATIATLTGAASAWSATKPTVTSSKPHIWMTRADVTVGAESTQVCVWEAPTRITPVDGNVTMQYQYLDGQVMRLSDWSSDSSGKPYWNGTNRIIINNGTEVIDQNEGTYYLDVVSYNGDYYKCISNTTKGSTNPANDSTHWELFSFTSAGAFHNLLVDEAAYIESLTSKQVVITDGTGANTQIVAGMASGSDIASASGNQTVGNVRIWAGTPTTNGNLTTAPFTVDKDGKLVSDDAEITGTIHAESGSIDGTLTIGSNGELVSNVTESGVTVQTTVSATEITNTATSSTYSYETTISEGKVQVKDKLGSYQMRAQLEPDDLQFYSTDGSNGVSVYEAVTTPMIIDGVMAGSGANPFIFIKHIVRVTAIPANASDDTLYIVV